MLETKGKETQLYNTTTVCLGLGGRKKHTHTTDKLFLQDQTSAGGAAAPSASTPPSAKSDPASDDDTVGGSTPQRNLSAPHLGRRRRGLLQELDPSRWPNRSLRSLSQLSPEDISPAHGLGNPTPGWSRQWTTRPGSGRRFYASSAWEVPSSWANEVFFSSQLCLCPC
jgi:hypothetical protein